MSEADGYELPHAWAIANLEDIVDILDGERVPVNSKERAHRAGDVPYYGATGRVGWIDDYLFDEELVLLGEDGAAFFDKSRHVAYRITGKSWVNNHAHVLRALAGISAPLLAQQLNVIDYHPYVGGTTRLKLNQAPMRRIPLRIPPLAEQERIAEALDELLSDLDAGAKPLEEVRHKLKLYRASVLSAAVNGRLTAEWREQHPDTEPASELLKGVLLERRRRWEEQQLTKYEGNRRLPPRNWKEKYREPVSPDITNLPLLPDGWCWATVDQVSSLLQYGTSAKANSRPSGVPVLRMGNVTADGRVILNHLKYLPADHAEFPDLLLKEGDLLFNRTNSAELVGKTAVYSGFPTPVSFASYLIRVRLMPGLSPAAVAYALNAPYGRAWIKAVVNQTVGQANVNGTKLAAFTLPLAPRAEQEAIVEGVEDQLSVIDHLEADLDARLKASQTLRRSLLRHAFTGRLVPQDPSDEPASELLKRIAAERDASNAGRRPARAPRTAKRRPARRGN